MNQPVPLQWRLAGKLLRHDQQLEVPFAATTHVASMCCTVVANLQPDGVKRILHHRADPFNPGGCVRTQVLPRCNHSA